MTEYVLIDTLETHKRKKTVYFGGMTGIGPKYTESLAAAQRFESKQAAMQSPAYNHFLCFFKPSAVEEDDS